MEPLARPAEIFTKSGVIYSGPCVFFGFLLGMDGTNDPSITIYNNTAENGNEVIPTNTYDASALGLNGATGMRIYCDKGLYLSVSCAGTVEIIPLFTPWH